MGMVGLRRAVARWRLRGIIGAGKAEIDPDLTKAYRGTVSLPFEPGEHRRIAVKIVDDRGIESLKVLEVAI